MNQLTVGGVTVTLIRMPVLGVNDAFAQVMWEAEDGAQIHLGQTLFVASTSKAIFEVAAEGKGILARLADNNVEVETGKPVAAILDREADRALIIAAITELLAPKPSAECLRFSKKAEVLASENGISIDDIQGEELVIKEAEVLKAIALRRTKPGKQALAENVRDTVFDAYPQGAPKRILVIGAGRGAVQVLDVLIRDKSVRVVGAVDDEDSLQDKTVLDIPVIGKVGDVKQFFDAGKFDEVVISFSNAREARKALFSDLRSHGIPFANVIDPSVQIHSSVQMGTGNMIMANCRLGSCTLIGDNNFLSAYVNLEHHNTLGSHCTFGPAVSTSSRCSIEDDVKLGTGIFMEPGVVVGAQSIVGSGTILVVSIPPRSLVRTRIDYQIEPLPPTRS